MKTIKITQVASVLMMVVLIIACNQPKKDVLTIAAAANTQFALEKLSEVFTEQTGIVSELVISSSGKLTAQIKEGAPYDIFIAANMKYPNELYKSNLAVAPPKIYGAGQLVLWSVYDHITPSVAILNNESIQHIALANPRTAPYGEAAVEVLRNKRLYDEVNHKLVFGESISQTNQFIISKSAEIGFTAKSVVLSPKMKGKGSWVALDQDMYSPISQGVVMIKGRNERNENVQKFYDFLFSPEAKEILKDFGYLVAE